MTYVLKWKKLTADCSTAKLKMAEWSAVWIVSKQLLINTAVIAWILNGLLGSFSDKVNADIDIVRMP